VHKKIVYAARNCQGVYIYFYTQRTASAREMAESSRYYTTFDQFFGLGEKRARPFLIKTDRGPLGNLLIGGENSGLDVCAVGPDYLRF
jgi:hypothetical protein